MAQRLRHRAQVAHAVIDYNNFIHGELNGARAPVTQMS
jgi:hypothetical protein